MDATKLDGSTGPDMQGRTLTACIGWHAEAVCTAKNIGLETSVTHMPGGYSDRLYVTGAPSLVRIFLSLPQLRRNPNGALFSPGCYMPRWTPAS